MQLVFLSLLSGQLADLRDNSFGYTRYYFWFDAAIVSLLLFTQHLWRISHVKMH